MCAGVVLEMGTLGVALDRYDEEHSVPFASGAHANKSSKKDLDKVLKQLQDMKVFDIVPDRRHRSFAKLRVNMIRQLDKDKVIEWMIDHLAQWHAH